MVTVKSILEYISQNKPSPSQILEQSEEEAVPEPQTKPKNGEAPRHASKRVLEDLVWMAWPNE